MLRKVKKKVFTGLVIASSLLTGCGAKVSGELPREETQEFYYAIQETTLPDSQKTLTAPEGGHVEVFAPMLIGERVFRNASENERDYQSRGFYLQYLQALGADTPEWKNINIMDSEFELYGIQYDGFDSFIYASVDGNMYTSAYILENSSSYIVQFGEEGIEEVKCRKRSRYHGT